MKIVKNVKKKNGICNAQKQSKSYIYNSLTRIWKNCKEKKKLKTEPVHSEEIEV